jgi:hypothetical protein
MLDATDLERIRDIIKEEIHKSKESSSNGKTDNKKGVKNEL